jgi:hypothetical protein
LQEELANSSTIEDRPESEVGNIEREKRPGVQAQKNFQSCVKGLSLLSAEQKTTHQRVTTKSLVL